MADPQQQNAPKIFTCSLCSFTAPYSVFGRSLGAGAETDGGAVKIVFLEDAFLLPDPNALRVQPLCVGSNCSLCGCMVCTNEACSLFYAKRFCANCARANAIAFPAQCIKLSPKIFTPAPAPGARS